MTLLTDDLSVWEIGFRWAGFDPYQFRIGIPLLVRDNFRTLMNDIHWGYLECLTLAMEKYHGDDSEIALLHIRAWIDEIEECSNGKRYDRKLLHWARIDRQAMQIWCERRKIPLPEFWFPPGWNIQYEWPDDTPEEDKSQKPGESLEEQRTRIDRRHRIKMACQQVALSLWTKQPAFTIKEIAMGNEVQELASGNEFELETVQEWISEVDPREPSKKRGRKRKNNSGSSNVTPP